MRGGCDRLDNGFVYVVIKADWRFYFFFFFSDFFSNGCLHFAVVYVQCPSETHICAYRSLVDLSCGSVLSRTRLLS